MEVRRATAADVEAVSAVARAAFEGYLGRIGRPPAPMLADYGAAISDCEVWVASEGDEVVGVVVLVAEPGTLLLDTVAVAPGSQGRGLGRTLVALAERRARELGLGSVNLYTNQAMTANLDWYPQLGYVETHRAEQDGYHRVFFTKPVGDPEHQPGAARRPGGVDPAG